MFYQKVTEYCKENNISIHAFEKKCGLGNGTVSRWKDEKSEPSMAVLKKLIDATGIPANEWIE